MYKIMIIEDDEGLARAIAGQARAWNFDVLCAADFRNILGEFAAYGPHLVLLDISLPFLTDITGAGRSGRFPGCRSYSFLRHPTI